MCKRISNSYQVSATAWSQICVLREISPAGARIIEKQTCLWDEFRDGGKSYFGREQLLAADKVHKDAIGACSSTDICNELFPELASRLADRAEQHTILSTLRYCTALIDLWAELVPTNPRTKDVIEKLHGTSWYNSSSCEHTKGQLRQVFEHQKMVVVRLPPGDRLSSFLESLLSSVLKKLEWHERMFVIHDAARDGSRRLVVTPECRNFFLTKRQCLTTYCDLKDIPCILVVVEKVCPHCTELGNSILLRHAWETLFPITSAASISVHGIIVTSPHL